MPVNGLPVIARRLILSLVIVALGLPIGICLLLALSRVLGAMGDAVGAAAVDRLALAGGVLWVMSLIALVVLQAIASLDEPDE